MIEILVAVVAGLAAGAVLAWLAARAVIAQLEGAVDWHRKQEQVATDRLVHAWKDGAVVPPRPADPTPAPDPLPEELQTELDQWDDPEHRAMLEARMRDGLQRGRGVTAILMELDNLHP